jgi:uncharacterized membrane protein
MECSSARESGEFLLIARRNNSLSSTGRSIVLGSLVSLSFAISLAFAVVGAWLVLPFAGAEMVVLVLAFRYIERHSGDFESIALKGDSVLVEKWELGAVRRYEFNRCWAQVLLHRAGPAGRTTLALRSHGREVEFGQHLSEDQKEAVAQTLRRQLRPSTLIEEDLSGKP